MDTGGLAGDEITLRLPARAGFARVARVAATALAERAGFGLEQVEEVRMAVGEAWALLLGEADHDGSVELHLEVRPDGLGIDLSVLGGPAGPPTATPGNPAAAATVLARVVDQHVVGPDGRSIRMVKRG
ncbi:MAG: ATP-binding protein [Acidimicrobiia bacterium]